MFSKKVLFRVSAIVFSAVLALSVFAVSFDKCDITYRDVAVKTAAKANGSNSRNKSAEKSYKKQEKEDKTVKKENKKSVQDNGIVLSAQKSEDATTAKVNTAKKEAKLLSSENVTASNVIFKRNNETIKVADVFAKKLFDGNNGSTFRIFGGNVGSTKFYLTIKLNSSASVGAVQIDFPGNFDDYLVTSGKIFIGTSEGSLYGGSPVATFTKNDIQNYSIKKGFTAKTAQYIGIECDDFVKSHFDIVPNTSNYKCDAAISEVKIYSNSSEMNSTGGNGGYVNSKPSYNPSSEEVVTVGYTMVNGKAPLNDWEFIVSNACETNGPIYTLTNDKNKVYFKIPKGMSFDWHKYIRFGTSRTENLIDGIGKKSPAKENVQCTGNVDVVTGDGGKAMFELTWWGGNVININTKDYWAGTFGGEVSVTYSGGGTTETGGNYSGISQITSKYATLASGYKAINMLKMDKNGNIKDPGYIPPSPSSDPSTSSEAPSTSSAEPGTSSIDPGVTSTEPSTSSMDPGTTSVDPGTTSTEPGTTSVNPSPTSSSYNPQVSSQPSVPSSSAACVHEYKFDKIENVQGGVKKHKVCKKCGADGGWTFTPSSTVCSHVWSTSMYVMKAPTYFAPGIRAYKCIKCGLFYNSSAYIQSIAKNKLKKPKFTLKKKGRKLLVKYNKVKNATGVQIKYARGSESYKIKKVNTKSTKTIKIKVKKPGKYKVRIRAYIKKSGKTAYSPLSKVKKIKIK